jgi:small subunit ribosomal protein S20
MANHFAALKRMRIEKRRTEINRARKTRFRSQVKALRTLLERKDAGGAEALLPKTFSLIDRAAKCGIVTKQTAARYKSRLHARIKSLQGSPA